MEENNASNQAANEPNLETVVEEITTKEELIPSTPAPSKKQGKGMIIVMVCLCILAISAIAFGVWAMMDKTSEVNNLNNQIENLKAQNENLQTQLIDCGYTGEIHIITCKQIR